MDEFEQEIATYLSREAEAVQPADSLFIEARRRAARRRRRRAALYLTSASLVLVAGLGALVGRSRPTRVTSYGGSAPSGLFSCQVGGPFDAEAARRPATADDGADTPAHRALLQFLAAHGTDPEVTTGAIVVLSSTADQVQYRVGQLPRFTLAVVTSSGAEWRVSAYGQCEPTAGDSNRTAVAWQFRGYDEASRQLTIAVSLPACNGADKPPTVTAVPEVMYSDEEVTVTLYASRAELEQVCFYASYDIRTVQLTEPLGSRTLTDGATEPHEKRLG